MTTIQRPNKKALIDVIDIYRDAMRPFLVHHLKQVRGKSVEDAIRQALRDNQVNQFEQNLRTGRSVEESIDVNDFPELVRFHWRDVFSNKFPGDRVMQNRLYEIKAIRDEASHVDGSDLDEEKTRAHIYMVADVLSKIGRTEEKEEVEKIRDDLFVRPGPEATSQTRQPQATQGTFEEISINRIPSTEQTKAKAERQQSDGFDELSGIRQQMSDVQSPDGADKRPTENWRTWQINARGLGGASPAWGNQFSDDGKLAGYRYSSFPCFNR